ncbi:hypothetical protein [Phytohabitans kaempferiae]|uniref:Uncharacterized protein n=1 Tax=Phytohabitans kaempferiae TaxID=1620943 RepID=A0ABV6ME80_9ACTN
MIDSDALADELKSLRKGRAARHPALSRRLGPQVRRLCAIADTDTSAECRAKLMAAAQRLLAHQPQETRLAVLAALALHPETEHRTLHAREAWLAQRLHVHERTARRRVDDGILLLAEMTAGIGRHQAEVVDGEDWRVRSLDAVLRLDAASPQLIERRTIMVTGGEVGEIIHRMSVPVARRAGSPTHDLQCEVMHGARIKVRDRPSDDHFVYRLDLPRRFRVGEIHEYGLRFQIPPGQPMANHYVMQPLNPCDSFDLTIRFPPDRLPGRIWQLDGVAPRLVDRDQPIGSLLRPDRFGELRVSFQGLRQGRAYGLKWTDKEDG